MMLTGAALALLGGLSALALHSPRSSHTVTSPGASPGSTWTTRGRQHTAQSSVYVWCSPPPGST